MDNPSFQSNCLFAFYRLAEVSILALESCQQDLDVKTPTAREMFRRMNIKLTKERELDLSAKFDEVINNLEEVKDLSERVSDGEVVEPGIKSIKIDDIDTAAVIMETMRTSLLQAGGGLTKSGFLAETAIVSIVSALEVFCTELFSEIFAHRPEAMPGEPSIPLKILQTLPNVRQGISWIAIDRAREATRGPVSAWLSGLAKFSGKQLQRSEQSWPLEWRYLCQLGQVRNCIVHAGGQIEEQLSKYAEGDFLFAAKDKKLTLSSKDVEMAVENVIRVASEILVGVSHKVFNRNKKGEASKWMAHFLSEYRIDLYERGLPMVARGVNCWDFRVELEEGQQVHTSWALSWVSDLLISDRQRREDVRQEATRATWNDSPGWRLVRSSIVDTDANLEREANRAIELRVVSYYEVMAGVRFSLLRSRLSAEALEAMKPPWFAD